jgi:hypothetical protein
MLNYGSMDEFFNTLTLLFVAASVALLWLNWREWQRKKVILAQPAGQDKTITKPLPRMTDWQPHRSELNLQGPLEPPILFAAKITHQVLPEGGTRIAAPSPIDTDLSKLEARDLSSQPVRELLPERCSEPVRDAAVDLEVWVANFEAVIRGRSCRSPDR